ncbi:MAG: CAP domain-containing protein [Desulfobulbaceae bacterium]
MKVATQPIIEFQVDKEQIPAGETVLLEWSVLYADTVVIEPDLGEVAAVGTTELRIEQTATYTLTANGPGGSASASVTVTVVPLPHIDFVADPGTIQPGASSSLTWNVRDANMISIDQGIGDVTALTSIIVTPSATTTYTMTATGIGGTSTASITVKVAYPAPTVSMTATPQLIQPGETVTLSWNSSEADSVTIDQGVGEVDTSGSLQMAPAKTTLYTITATGQGGTAVGWVRVFVAATGGYSYGDPSPAEQAHLEAINRARANPEAEAERLGIGLYEGLPEGTINGVPRQPLVMNSRLLQAASLHAQDMIDHQFFAHVSPTDGRDPYTRITDAGYQYRYAGENIGGQCPEDGSSAADAGLAIHRELFIDAGVEGRGHRLTLLDNRYKEIGIGMAAGPYTGNPNCYMITDDFAQSLPEPRSFITGVVYNDTNEDGQYTEGEGIGNAVLDVVEAGLQTVTASAGGYGIPAVPGAYTLVATLPGGFEVAREITISDQNIKADFLYEEFGVEVPTVDLTSNVATIAPGDSATLSWNSRHGYSVTLDNGIGAVAASGSLVVTPAATTTYTIIVTGLAGTVTKSITITVSDSPPPTVRFRATPELIAIGGHALLSWSSYYADTCEISPEIGAVSLSGSQEVAPAVTTAYTLTCTGPGGTASAEASVSYPLPVVHLTAQPVAILAGQGTDLSWQVTDATTVTIDNGIGLVAASGTQHVVPAATTTYIITAVGPGGTTIESISIEVLSHDTLGVQITYPVNGQALSTPFTLIKGIVTPGDAEVGLIVNGLPAQRAGNTFFVNNVPLNEGENTLTVYATTADGTSITDSIQVFADTSETDERITLELIPETGVSPFKTTLYVKLNNLERSIRSSSLTYDGPGAVTIAQVDPAEYDLEIAAPGLYTLTCQATDDLGNVFQHDIYAVVYDRTELSSMLQGKWNFMRTALAAGDINGALGVISSNAKDMYSYNFNLLSSHLGEIAAGLQDITLIDMHDGEAEFEMLGEQDEETYSFYVVFIHDEDGVWRLRFF